MKSTLLALLLGGAVAAIPATGAATVAPDLSAALGRAALVVAAQVGEVQSYDSGRLTVAHLRIAQTLKGKETTTVAVVERHDLASSRPLLEAQARVVALLAPARRNSAMQKVLPEATYYEIYSRPAGVLAAPDEATFQQTTQLVTRLLAARRSPAQDPTRRVAEARALAFDEVAATHAVLVGDGARALPRFADLATTLSTDEQTRLHAALQRTDLPAWVRTALVEAIGKSQLRQLVPSLRQLPQPDANLQRTAWTVLRQLGAAPTAEDLVAASGSSDTNTRLAAVAALAEDHGDAAREPLERLAQNDPEPRVRLAAIDALGHTGEAALPTLGRIFVGDDWSERRAAGRSITTIGGRPAAETLARLAFDGPPDAQKFAVTLLLMTGIAHDDPLVQKIATQHPDESVRHIIESGLEVHDH